ncbi:MAG: stage II sporulation protein D [Turicibacter sp.]|nr:stage II sporulation protein D [Turicibacter sp.]
MKLDRKTKKALAIVVGFIGILILMPMMIMSFASTVDTPSFVGVSFDFLSGDVDDVLEEAPNNFYITVYRTETSEFQEIEFERYLIGVVAAEMPALFELDALRAQAIAARTYAMRILAHDDYILDTVMHQVFLDDDQLRDRWGDAFDVHFATIEEAVTSTQGIVITHEGELITPMFFAMSNGATENSEDVFPSERPYLRSVASSGYEDHDRFAVEEGFSIENLRAAFGDDNITIDNIIILEESAGGNVAQVQVGSEIFTGRDVREILGLRSASFSVAEAPGGILFTTYGNGHGVGMSQHGANVMAQNGADYREILQHFYQDVELVEVFLTNDE